MNDAITAIVYVAKIWSGHLSMKRHRMFASKCQMLAWLKG